MGVALYIVPEREVEGLDTFVNGKALGHSEHLEQLAERAGVRPLMEFFSQDPEDLAEFLDTEGAEPTADGLPAEQWFPAADGLVTVRGLLSYLSAESTAVPDATAIIGDLQEFESVLGRLAAEGVQWHLSVDF
jgi:hypothetical protein